MESNQNITPPQNITPSQKKVRLLERAYWEYHTTINSYMISKSYKQNYIIQFNKWLESIKEHQKKSNKRRTIKNNIDKKHLTWYCTLTLNPQKKGDKTLKELQKSINIMMSRNNIQYVLVPEYHESGAIHFHGFLNIPNPDLIERKIINGKSIKDRYGNPVYILAPFEKNYGFTQLINIANKNEYTRNRTVNYIVKYAIKDNSKIMSSRCNPKMTSLQKAIAFFGNDLVNTTPN
jgi:hypothetical protein